MNIVLLGAPGAGKGTQAEKMVKEYNVPHVSTGDIFRKAVSDKTEMGIKAKAYMDRGELVPDEIVIGIVKERLMTDEFKDGFILDGFPRTVAQADALAFSLGEMGKKLDMVLSIDVDKEELIQRLTGRRVCNCGKTYHMVFNPPRKDEICDECGEPLKQRDDDKIETVNKRLDVYFNQTLPLINYYKNNGLLRVIDGRKSASDVFEEIRGVIGVYK
ncbi:MAG: adenylate kinase [Actinobacteria bacterium]|nr:adenylate kinase [Actinomycetota bacterium]